jgi:hypothetical protein
MPRKPLDNEGMACKLYSKGIIPHAKPFYLVQQGMNRLDALNMPCGGLLSRGTWNKCSVLNLLIIMHRIVIKALIKIWELTARQDTNSTLFLFVQIIKYNNCQ